MLGSESLDGSSLQLPVAANKYGVTKPISLAGPTEADFQRNAELEKVDVFLNNLLEIK